MCNALSHHRLVLTGGGRIKCEKCWGMWDLNGSELVPNGYPDWAAWRDNCEKNNLTPPFPPETHCSGKNGLSAREVAHVLVEELIYKNQLQDPTEVRALRHEAAQNSELFIDQVLGRNYP